MKKASLNLCFGLIFICCIWVSDFINEVRLPVSGEVAELYSTETQDNLQKTYTKAIQEAKTSISLLVYSLTDPEIIQALRQKAETGVKIKVICDAKASPYVSKKLGSKITCVKHSGKGLMHLKLLIIDEKQTWIGSANMTGESLRMHGNLVTALECPHLASMILNKAAGIKEYESKNTIPHQTFEIGKQQVEMWFLPDNREGSLRIKELMRSAKKTLWVAMFTFTRFDFAKEIIEAQKRGVKVGIVIDKGSSKGASASIVNLLKQANIAVRINKGSELLHHKFLYVDGKTLAHGSANWTKAAFNTNQDCFMILHDLTPKQQEQMKQLWKTIIANSSIIP